MTWLEAAYNNIHYYCIKDHLDSFSTLPDEEFNEEFCSSEEICYSMNQEIKVIVMITFTRQYYLYHNLRDQI